MRYEILIILFVLTSSYAKAQSFEGELNYVNYYISHETKKPLFEPIFDIELHKESNVKIEMQDASDGALELELFDYNKNTGLRIFSNKHSDGSYVVTDEPVTYQENGVTKFNPKAISKKLEKKIKKFTPCSNSDSTTSKFIEIDTLFIISGLKSKVVKEVKDDVTIREIYFSDSIKIHSSQYECNRVDGLDKFYEYSNGSLITQSVYYTDLYIYIRQLQAITPKALDNKIFSVK